MNDEERRHFYRNIQTDSIEIERVVNYLNNLGRPRYHYFNPPDPENFTTEDNILRLEEDVDFNEIWY